MFTNRLRRSASTSSSGTNTSNFSRNNSMRCATVTDKQETCTHPIRRWETTYLKSNGDTFTPRTGHTVVEYKGNIYLFGGTDCTSRKNDLYRFSIADSQWTLIKTKGGKPSIRSGAVGCVVNDKMYLFGGYDGRDGNYYNDLYEFDFQRDTWKTVRSKRRPNRRAAGMEDTESVRYYCTPEPRTDHVVVPYEGCLYVFGGYDGTQRFRNVYAFDLKTSVWRMEALDSKMKPSARFGHSGVVHDDKFYLFGGWDGHVTLEDMWTYNFKAKKWYLVHEHGNPYNSQHIPSNRYRHSAIVHENHMYIFGGVDKEYTRFNDLHRFNFCTKTWEPVKYSGIVPSTRTFHRAVVVGSRMYILGGYDGDNRLNDLRSIQVGNFSPPSLLELCARQLRQSLGKVCVDRDDVVANHLSSIIWNRDMEGVLRGCVSSKFGTTQCTGFELSGVFDDDEYHEDREKCASCGISCYDHDEISESRVFRTNLFENWQPEMETSNRQPPRSFARKSKAENKKRRTESKSGNTSISFLRKSMLINNLAESGSQNEFDSDDSEMSFTDVASEQSGYQQDDEDRSSKSTRSTWLPSRRRKMKSSNLSAATTRLRSRTKTTGKAMRPGAVCNSRTERTSVTGMYRDVLGDLLNNICFPGEESKQ